MKGFVRQCPKLGSWMAWMAFWLLSQAVPCLVHASKSGGDDHDHARHARLAGRALPLTQILSHLGDRLGGEVVGVAFVCKRDDVCCRYRFRVLTPQKNLREVLVDAATGRVLERDWGCGLDEDHEQEQEEAD
jgi:uncharacterized membrane protein YkoI